jgi:hypothetical protein
MQLMKSVLVTGIAGAAFVLAGAAQAEVPKKTS